MSSTGTLDDAMSVLGGVAVVVVVSVLSKLLVILMGFASPTLGVAAVAVAVAVAVSGVSELEVVVDEIRVWSAVIHATRSSVLLVASRYTRPVLVSYRTKFLRAMEEKGAATNTRQRGKQQEKDACVGGRRETTLTDRSIA
jgi:hypothetical protein